jgi:hypothetical protein
MGFIKMSKKVTINKIPEIYYQSKNLEYIKDYCILLEKLNLILQNSIPEYMKEVCHFGAINHESNIIILFVEEQQIFHYLRTISEHILQNLNKNNFYFDGILIKIKQKKTKKPTKPQNIIPKERYERLKKFADFINKPELLKENIVHIEEKEIDI